MSGKARVNKCSAVMSQAFFVTLSFPIKPWLFGIKTKNETKAALKEIHISKILNNKKRNKTAVYGNLLSDWTIGKVTHRVYWFKAVLTVKIKLV